MASVSCGAVEEANWCGMFTVAGCWMVDESYGTEEAWKLDIAGGSMTLMDKKGGSRRWRATSETAEPLIPPPR